MGKILIYTLTALNALEAINYLDLYPFFYDGETNSFYGKSDGFAASKAMHISFSHNNNQNRENSLRLN
jgi:hypothetical protein